MPRRRNKAQERGLAGQRIDDLLAAARAEALAGRRDLGLRYGRIALRVAQTYQSGLAPAQKAMLCRKCGAPRSAATSRSRLAGGRLAVTCLVCGHVARRPLHGSPGGLGGPGGLSGPSGLGGPTGAPRAGPQAGRAA